MVQNGKPWILKLVAVCCTSLAFKMRKTEYSVFDLVVTPQSCISFHKQKTFVYLCFLYLFLLCWVGEQHDGGFVFDSSTIERMEMLILGALKWRMRSVNPFSFTDYFISFFKFKDKPSVQDLKNRATEIILKSQSGWFSRIEEFRQLLIVNIYTWFNNGVLLLFL